MRWRAWLALSLAAAGCVPEQGGWRRDLLLQRSPEARQLSLARLTDAPPYFSLTPKGLVLHLCRWPHGTIPVSLPPSASAAERRHFELALAAWQALDLGVSFREVPPAQAAIRIDFSDSEELALTSGDVIASCRVSGLATEGASRVDARTVFASVHLRRWRRDALDRRVPLSASERVGVALHELGHALGFPGHVARGGSVMMRDVAVVERWGKRVLEGRPLEDATLAALYRLPSGAVVGEIELAPGERAPLLRLAARARSAQWIGPFVRVGGRAAQLFWRSGGRTAATLDVDAWVEVVAGRESFAERAVLSNVATGTPRVPRRTPDR